MYLPRPLIPVLFWTCLWPLAGQAEPFAGDLIAERDCPAGVSTRHQGNPGQVRLVPGTPYRIVGRNRAEPTHWLLRLETAEPKERWVEVGCGRLVAPLAGAPPLGAAPEAKATTPPPGGMEAQLVLAVSWQPAFCETHGRRPECLGQTAQRTDAQAFSLHGLWPQPIGRAYCGVGRSDHEAAESGDWQRLPVPDLSPATRALLQQRMPGTASNLERHEWIKHGTCYG